MRRRILQSTLGVVAFIGVLLGLPLMFTAWQWVQDQAHADMQSRLERMAAEILEQEGEHGLVQGGLNSEPLRLVVPRGGRLVVVYPTPKDSASQIVIGEATVPNAIVESLSMGTSGSLRLEIPSDAMRAAQVQAVGVVALVVVASIAAGAVVAVVTARRLADPLQHVAERAARLGAGDFRPDPRRHGIAELDRVSDVLDASAGEIAGRLQREHEMVGDVSHQLRSRLTAIRLRLDELSVHPDPDVVTEAGEAMAQVDRLTTGVDEMVRASRSYSAAGAALLDVGKELEAVVAEWQVDFAEVGRELVLHADPGSIARVTPSRVREAVAALIDNSLEHGGGTTTVAVRTVMRSNGPDPDRDAPNRDVPNRDAPTRDVPNLDAPNRDVPNLDAPNLDAPNRDVTTRDVTTRDAPDRDVTTREPSGTVHVEVSDEGQGVSDALAPHIFDRGFSGGGSTGVGLALARALTEADGGRLELQRRRPALFALFLPATANAQEILAMPREPR